MNKGVKINGDNNNYLSVKLKDILVQIGNEPCFKWAILWIYAVGELDGQKNILEFESEVNLSKNIIVYDWQQLVELSDKFEQIMEIVLIGSKDSHLLKRYSNIDEMHSSCDFTIELIDSSYWLIYSSDNIILDRICDKLPGANYLH